MIHVSSLIFIKLELNVCFSFTGKTTVKFQKVKHDFLCSQKQWHRVVMPVYMANI